MFKRRPKYGSEASSLIGDTKSVTSKVVLPSRQNILHGLTVIKNHIIVVGLAVLLLTSGVFFAYAYQRHDTAFIINGERYSKVKFEDKLNKLPNQSMLKSGQSSRSKIFSSYIELEKMRFAARKSGINMPISLLNQISQQHYAKNFNELATTQQQGIYQQAIATQVPITKAGDFAGYVYVFPFSNNIPSGAIQSSDTGNKVAIAKDKQYAQQEALFYRDQLQSKKMTNAQALSAVLSDKLLRYLNSSNDSTQFVNTITQSWETTIRSHEITAFIKSLKKAGLSEIQTLKIQNNKTGQQEDARYYFVDLSRVGSAVDNADTQYQNVLQSLAVKIMATYE